MLALAFASWWSREAWVRPFLHRVSPPAGKGLTICGITDTSLSHAIHHQGLWLQLAVPLVVGALAQALAAEVVSQVATLLLIGKWLPWTG